MLTDPIADFLTRIRNAITANKEQVVIPHSKTKLAILKVMKDRNFITDYKESKTSKFPEIEIQLNHERPAITLTRISKPGQRMYAKSSSIKKVNGGLGVTIISTPRGIMSGEDALKMKVGGEILCEIY